MALFGTKKEKKTQAGEVASPGEEKKAESSAAEETAPAGDSAPESKAAETVLLNRPRITEKASLLMESKVYTFEVVPKANKVQIKTAVKSVYGVTPEKVRIVTLPLKRVMRNTRRGARTGFSTAVKKAYVQLKKGESIDVM